MSLLTLIREEAIVANVQKGNEAWKMITECMRSVAKAGDPNVRITVSDAMDPEALSNMLTNLRSAYSNLGESYVKLEQIAANV